MINYDYEYTSINGQITDRWIFVTRNSAKYSDGDTISGSRWQRWLLLLALRPSSSVGSGRSLPTDSPWTWSTRQASHGQKDSPAERRRHQRPAAVSSRTKGPRRSSETKPCSCEECRRSSWKSCSRRLPAVRKRRTSQCHNATTDLNRHFSNGHLT